MRRCSCRSNSNWDLLTDWPQSGGAGGGDAVGGADGDDATVRVTATVASCSRESRRQPLQS